MKLRQFHLFAALVLALSLTSLTAQASLDLKQTDIVTGSGKAAAAGDILTVRYTGWLFAPKAKMQRGRAMEGVDQGPPFSFKLGVGAVIKGWDQGLTGMKAGGTRTLIVPAELAYGDQGKGRIPPNANLIYEVELIEIK